MKRKEKEKKKGKKEKKGRIKEEILTDTADTKSRGTRARTATP